MQDKKDIVCRKKIVYINAMKEKSLKNKQIPKQPFKTVGQFLYLTTKFFMSNKLTTYASACALGFLFSFIPIMVIVMLAVVRFLHTTPDIIFQFFDLPSIFVNSEKFVDILENITAPGKSSFLTVLLVISIFWMGQRFFFSIQTGMRTVFHSKAIKRRPLLENIFLFIGEIALVIGIVLLIFILVTARTLSARISLFDNIDLPMFPKFVIATLKTNIFNILPYAFIFVVSAFMYKFGSGSKPKWGDCFFASFLCTLSFWLFTVFMKIFFNAAKYNLVYGVLSSLIIMLLEVYTFFVIYFFVAQGIFVKQFFSSLLLSELYLWDPNLTTLKTKKAVKNALFSIPNQLISNENQRLVLEKDTEIYSENSETDGVYYIVKGEVQLFKENYCRTVKKGSFFGDFDCILEQNRSLSAKTTTSATLIFINKNQFDKIIESDPDVPQKMIETAPEYLNRVYGRK